VGALASLFFPEILTMCQPGLSFVCSHASVSEVEHGVTAAGRNWSTDMGWLQGEDAPIQQQGVSASTTTVPAAD
jgi:hypothetical protein